ncbi:hypothetical protein HHI36_003370 [Cryptolaemus montrouzieri]|uniref:GOLD domain-containing protein n=1 Tax=Cryptolaemus montrouzieri TaxID=559131 RepID=A0ABD2PDZ1_9CUCU
MEIWGLCILLFSLFLSVNSIMFNLAPNTYKCLKEELQQNVPVIGEYEISEAPGQKVDYIVKDSKGHTLSQKKTSIPQHQRGITQEVSLITKHGVDVKNYDAFGEAANLKPIETELQRLEDLSNEIVQDFAYMRKREEEMRDTNESTNNRVLYFSIFSMCCLLGLATWQVLYLRRYFKAKKLIE